MPVNSLANLSWNGDIRLAGYPSNSRSGIDPEDARRQTVTAKEIITRLRTQHGLVLADEVGLGKTFVAMAVAASVATSTGRRDPVVVMVPPALIDKWPEDWNTFASTCLPLGHGLRQTPETITRSSDFLKIFDNPAATRVDIAFVTHGALTLGIRDPLVQLAIIRAGFRYQRHLVSRRHAFPWWASYLWRHSKVGRALTPGLAKELLVKPIDQWHAIWNAHNPSAPIHDDPVYLQLTNMISEHADLRDLRDALEALPVNNTDTVYDRIDALRPQLMNAVQAVWDQVLCHAPYRSPLLILDEAHHVKNDNQVASLFSAEVATDLNALSDQGALANKFDRMLFLTATPFQLGHRELVNVLRRFDGMRWSSTKARYDFDGQMTALEATLDGFRSSALRLESAWSKITEEDTAMAPSNWWDTSVPAPAVVTGNARLVAARSVINDVGSQCAATQAQLRPWLIRHVRPDAGRRRLLPGDSVRLNGSPAHGLAIPEDMQLPFLVAARARTLVADRRLTSSRARAYFADGLASSFEAYRDTRANRQGFLDGIDDADPAAESEELDWYLKWISETLPANMPGVSVRHPKVGGTVERTVDMWRRGEKVLIFTFYLETGRSLQRAISNAIETEILQSAATHLAITGATNARVRQALDRVGVNTLGKRSKHYSTVERELLGMCETSELDRSRWGDFASSAVRFMRTDSFLTRYLIPSGALDGDALSTFDHADAAGQTLRRRLERFLDRLVELTPERQERTLERLRRYPTGRHVTGDPREGLARVLPNVRLANGGVSRETKDLLVETFKMPFLPEVLISSRVLGEGVDLHWECRTVIHHDLDWNPSVIEQRNGRLDRLRSWAADTQQPIDIYEPYTAGLPDEKTYRVVKDRSRWFSIVMGDRVDLSEESIDEQSRRVPLPEELAGRLTLDLAVYRPTS